jgi:hypothetical protein
MLCYLNLAHFVALKEKENTKQPAVKIHCKKLIYLLILMGNGF